MRKLVASTSSQKSVSEAREHPRTIGWLGTAALAMGGSNQSLFLLAGAGGLIATQGSASVPLLIIGLLLAWAAAPGWIELVLMYPKRVGGIASSCAEAFRPYSPVLANLTGTCYWWGWVPTCGLTAILSATAIHQWYLPHVRVSLLATLLIAAFTCVNLLGVKTVVRCAIPIATGSALLAFLSGMVPIFSGHVDWHQATRYHLLAPFPGPFGRFTSAMAGLYLIGFAAPAFEAATCHVGETIDPVRNVPRAVFGSAAMAAIFFVILPIVWLGTLGPLALCDDLINILGPTFAPVFGMGARAAAVWFMMLNMFQGTLQPLAGASRTLSQLAEDGLLPEVVGRRSSTDCPWVATLLTAGMAILFLQTGDPPWVLAAANLTYLIGIGMPSIAVWLLRRDAPEMVRPYRAPRGTIQLGILAAIVWGLSTIFGFEQFGLPCVLAGLVLAYSGSVFYAIRWWTDRRRAGLSTPLNSLHAKLTGSMLLVLILDGAGYLLAISHVPHHQTALIAELQDIFVAVALLTITVGLVLPGMIAHAAEQVAFAADRLARGTIADLSRAMVALGAGDLKTAYARIDVQSVSVRSGDEMSQMADSFNAMQNEIVRAANGLDCAREGLREARELQLESNARYELVVDASQDGLWDWDMLTDEVYLSPRWKSILGYEDDELENTYVSWIRTIHPDDTSRIFSAVDEYLCGNTLFYEVEFRMLHKDGGYRWVLAKGKAKRNEAGVAVRLAGSHTDITARILASEGILRAKEAAESANRAKSEFLAAMSHELRTPLNAILGFSEVLQDQNFGPLNARQARYVDHMLTSGRHLLHLINNVLDHSKIEAGHMSLDLEPCNLLTMLEEARSVSNVLAQSKSVTIEVSVDDNVPVVLADEIAFRQIMYNLISNAVKFTLFGGGIFVTAKDSGDFVEISVRDTGIGLSADNLRQIWGEFEQVDSSYSRQQEGTGLGLSLSRRLVEMHGGKIWASSPGEGGGSTFILTLPRCPSDTVSEEDRNTDNLGLAA